MAIYEKRLQNDLDQIHAMVAGMATRVSHALDQGVEVLDTRDGNQAGMIILRDQEINRDRRKLHYLCNSFLARHLPSGIHLRRIVSMFGLIDELERVGDYAAHLAWESIYLSGPIGATVKDDINLLANFSRQMLDRAMKSFLEDNAQFAIGIMEMTKQVEREYDRAIKNLAIEAERKIDNCSDLMDLHSVFHILKRITDRSRNICEQTVYCVSGSAKPEKRFDIVFLDEKNSCQSQIAEAVGHEHLPDNTMVRSAGWRPATHIDPRVTQFLLEQNHPASKHRPVRFNPSPKEIDGSQGVVVLLEKGGREYIADIPLHVVRLEWNQEGLKEGATDAEVATTLQEIHQELTQRIRELAAVVKGEGNV